MGEYEEMCDSMGLSAGSEEDYDRLTRAFLTGERPTPRGTSRTPIPKTKALLFHTFGEASVWSKKNDGKPFTRTADGLHFTPAGAELKAKPNSRQVVNDGPPSEAQLRFAALKAWRASVAREHNLPAYVIFHDQALADIASHAPQSMDASRKELGMGEKKLQAYGSDILRVVREVSGTAE
jgi:superfamily II DNA helicase RecQ